MSRPLALASSVAVRRRPGRAAAGKTRRRASRATGSRASPPAAAPDGRPRRAAVAHRRRSAARWRAPKVRCGDVAVWRVRPRRAAGAASATAGSVVTSWREARCRPLDASLARRRLGGRPRGVRTVRRRLPVRRSGRVARPATADRRRGDDADRGEWGERAPAASEACSVHGCADEHRLGLTLGRRVAHLEQRGCGRRRVAHAVLETALDHLEG